MTANKKNKEITVPINNLVKMCNKTINLTVKKLIEFIDDCFEKVVKNFFNENKLPTLTTLPINYKKTIEKLILRKINDTPEKYLFVLSYIHNFLKKCLTNRQSPLIKDNIVYLYFKVNPSGNYFYYYDTITSEVLNSIKSDDYIQIKNLIGGDEEQIRGLLECISDEIKFYLNNLNLEELVDEINKQFSKIKSDNDELIMRAYEELLLCILVDLGKYLEMPLDLSTIMIKKTYNERGEVIYPSIEKLTPSTIASEEEGSKVLEISFNTYKYYVSLFNKISKNYEKFHNKVNKIYTTTTSSSFSFDEVKYKNVFYLSFLGTVLHAAVYSITLPECPLYLLAVPSLKIIKQLEQLFTKYSDYYKFKINAIYNRSTKNKLKGYYGSFLCSDSFRFDPVSKTYKPLQELSLDSINSIKSTIQKRIYNKLNSLYHPIFIKKINDNFCYIVEKEEEKPKSSKVTKSHYSLVDKYRDKVANLYKIMYDLENKLINLYDTFSSC